MPWLGSVDLLLSITYTLLLVALLALSYRSLTRRG